jgi:glycerophosphoryl diester phosphodiesterase
MTENNTMKTSKTNFTLILLALFVVPRGYAQEESGNKGVIDFRDSRSIKNHRPIVIAHRGGVITTHTPECSIAAIRLAKQQGYDMVELDVQQSKDHVPVVFHDRDMKKACGIARGIHDLNADEIVTISYVHTDQMVCTLDHALSVCRSEKLGLMLDVKVAGDEKFFKEIATLIKKHGYGNASVTINGDPDLRKHLKDSALLTVTSGEFKKVQQGLACDLRNKFWFGLPQGLPSEMVKPLQQNGAYVIPAINTFRYPANGHYELARKDIQRLNEAGVDGYQIDSVYRPLFPEKTPEPLRGHNRLKATSSTESSYAVVVSESTHADPAWAPVVKALRIKYTAGTVTYKDRLDQALPGLKRQFPQYTCFVATPAEADRQFVAQVHRLTRDLDSDPYTDTIWGIVTGYTPADALRMAQHTEPLVVRRLFTGTVGSPLDSYDEGLMVNELKPNEMWTKAKGGTIRKASCPTDTTKLLADTFNAYQADAIMTSGHATERDWNPGYGYRSGRFMSKDGQPYGRDTQGKMHPIHSTNPKVWLAIGNCLIGHISDRQCMALAMMHSVGIYQMVGYTVPTGHGYGGWGVKDYFSELQAGRFTLAQANYCNNVALVYELERAQQNDGNKPGKLGGGLRGDRDVVAFYGDPAWQAQMAPRTLPWSQTLSEKDGLYTFTISGNQAGDWDNRPVIHFLPQRLKNIRIITGGELKPVITDNFILVPMHDGLEPMKGNRGERFPIKGDFQKGQTFTVIFAADTI